MKNTKSLIAIVAAVLLVALIYFVSTKQNTPKQPDISAEETTAADEEAANTNNEDKPEPVENPASVNSMEAKTHEILLAAMEYYDEVNNNTTIVSQNGRLYNAAAKILVSPKYLVDREYLSPDYFVEDASILYVSPAAVKEIIPMYRTSEEGEKVYVTVPVGEVYLIEASGEEQTTIDEGQYQALLSPYSISYGDVRQITAQSEEFADICAAIKEEDTKIEDSDLYIRYGKRNDKYAVVIVSPKNNYTKVYEYVLAFEDSKWQVKVMRLETAKNAKKTAINVCMDLDVEIMPNYELSDALKTMRTDPSGVTEALVQDGYLDAQNTPEIKYFSSAGKYMFVKYTDDSMFIGLLSDEDVWVLGMVESPENARERFLSVDDRAPDFVIIWE